MAEFLPMIALSPTMETGKIVKWKKKVGDAIEPGDVICEVETDKATMDYEATMDGTLLKIVAEPGDERAVGQPIAIIGEKGEDFSDLLAEAGDAKSEPKKKESKEEPKAEEKKSSKMEKEVAPSPKPAAKTEPAAASAPSGESNGGRVKASPLARKLADELGVSLATISGSGPGGRIVKADIESAAQGGGAARRGASPAALSTPVTAALDDKKIPISPKRKIIAQRLSESFFTAPHYFLRVAVRADGLMAARKAWNDANKDSKISLNALLMKLAAQAITLHPAVNSSWGNGEIIQRGSVDIGLAVAQDDGLITPIVRNCAGKGVLQIEAELRDLIDRALKGKLKPEEFQGATFTISNLGAWGIEEFTAIINPPGSAILAVGAIVREPVVGESDAIEIQQRMRLTLSCDHRVIDGAVGAAFAKDLKETIEYPIRALF